MGWWLMWEATSIIHRVPRVLLLLLLQSWVVEKAVIKELAAGVMGVMS